jgi:signal transduction histidine kinase
MHTLNSIAAALEPVQPDTLGEAVYQRFQSEPDTLCLAVVDIDGKPVGLVERNAFFLSMAAEFGRALCARRPISCLMNPSPLVVDAGRNLMAFCGEVLAEQPSELLHGFIVTRQGHYAGVGSALGLLQAAASADRRRNEELVDLASRLEEARGVAQTALDVKARFLTVMSHELRTPLNGVLTVADILAAKMGEARLQPYVRTIQDSGKQLLRLVNDILDLSRHGFENLELTPAPFDLAQAARETGDLWSAPAAKQGLGFHVRYEGPVHAVVLGDGVRLRQVLNNLISNAIKFTKTGHVEVLLAAQQTEGGLAIRARISDTGPGVAAHSLTTIFDAFSPAALRHEDGGAGTGLAMCREIIIRMGGEIHADLGPAGGLVVEAALTLPEAHMASQARAA